MSEEHFERAPLGDRFSDALRYASELHALQPRKGTKIPYVAHLLAVAALILEYGGDEDLAIAGLLHDAVEDQGGAATLKEIRRRYGERVAQIVNACSDTDTVPKPPWRQRKERHIAEIAHAEPEVRLVYAADKVHNARAILRDVRRDGDAVWSRFKGGKDGTLWYYERLVQALKGPGDNPLIGELEEVVTELKRAAAPAM